MTPRPQLAPPRDRYVYYPGTAEVPESQAVNIRNRSYTIGALVDIPGPGAQGVLFAHGVPLRRPRPLCQGQPAPLRLQLRRQLRADGRRAPRIIPTGENLILSAAFDKDGEDPPGIATGILSLYHGDRKVGEGRIKTQPGQVLHRRRGPERRPRQRRAGHRRLPRTAPLALHRRHDQARRRRRQRRALRRPRTRSSSHADRARVKRDGDRVGPRLPLSRGRVRRAPDGWRDRADSLRSAGRECPAGITCPPR